MGCVKMPQRPKINPETKSPETVIETYEAEMDLYIQRESGIKAYILASIPESIGQRIVNLSSACSMWESLSAIYEQQSAVMKADLLAQVHEVKCPDGGDPLKTIDEIVQWSNDYAAAGGVLQDSHAAAILIPLSHSHCDDSGSSTRSRSNIYYNGPTVDRSHQTGTVKRKARAGY